MIKSRDLIGRLIVTVTSGEIVGKVKDVLIDPETWEVAALVLPGKMFSRDAMIIPRHVIHVFGKDVVLVKSNEAMPRDDTLDHVASLIAVSGEMKGRQIATEKGVRVGVLNDVVINELGKVIAYDLAKVFVKGPLAESKEIPFHATRSVGPDLIIVDPNVLDSGQVVTGAQ
jgi:sporulation protein YlmC with PRC-barrel domain